MDELENKKNLNSQFPQVRFGINEQMDVEMLNSFISRKVNKGGANFKEKIFKYHPKLAGLDEVEPTERLERISAYVHEIYEKKKSLLEESQKDLDEAWKDYAPQFFEEAGKIFKGSDWPEGQYVGYLSVSSPFPRFLDSKTFQVPYNSVDSGLLVTAHEMLHFIFYEYVRKRYLPDLPNTDEKEMVTRLANKFTMPLWDLAETFNIIVLKGDEWGKGSPSEGFISYKDLLAHSGELEKIWEESGRDIDELFTRLEKKD